MKLVYTQENRFDVTAMRSYLESHGVPSLLKNDFTSSIMGEIPFFQTWPEVWVADELYEVATQLVKDAQSELAETADSDWVCSTCTEENPGTFELCWQCSVARKPLLTT